MSVKQALLQCLEQSKGQFISGGELSEVLHCSRAALSKAADSLRQEGYAIEAVPRRGYRLSEESDILSAEALRPLLDHPDAAITVCDTIPSTNRLLSRLASEEPLPSGSLVIADAQSGGKGHLGHSFYSPAACGLYLSVLIRIPSRDAQAQQHLQTLTCRAAVAACRAVRCASGFTPEIKWVNDLYARLGGEYRKIGGILTEAHTDFETGRCDYAIVGLGLNLFPPKDGYPPEIAGIAGSLSEVLSEDARRGLSRCRIAAAFVNELLRTFDGETAMDEYRALSMLPGKTVMVHDPFDPAAEPQHAAVLAVTEAGHLQVRFDDGSEKTLSFGDVSLSLSE